MPGMKFEIGQQVWRVACGVKDVRATCPDCAGGGRIRVMTPDDTIVSVECAGCRTGYDRSCGTIPFWRWKASVKQVTITGVEIDGENIQWKTNDSYRLPEDNLFTDEAACMAKAQVMAAEHEVEERERINKKEKNTRSWAWNASYHRRCLKEAQRKIEYHTAKLNIAKVKAKEPDGITT